MASKRCGLLDYERIRMLFLDQAKTFENLLRTHLENLQSQIQWLCRGLRFRDECCGGEMVSLYQQANAGDLWNNLLEQLQPLSCQVGREERHTCDVSAWPSETRDKPIANWVGDRRHDDGSGVVEVSNGKDCFGAVRCNHVHIQLKQFARQIGQSISASVRPTIYQD